MLLIGMFDSPFVRRVAVTMKLLQLPCEHANWSIGRDFDRIRQYNPLGRVPTLVVERGECLMESSAILDYLDELAGPERADITAVCVFTFLNDTLKVAADEVMFQSLATLAARCESLPAFQETRVPFFVPNS